MLSLEEQIERIADAAFDESSPFRWSPSIDGSATRVERHRSWLLTTAAVGLAVALVGGLIVLVTRDRDTPSTPVDSGVSTVPPAPPADTAPPSTDPVSTTATTLPSQVVVTVAPVQVAPYGVAVAEGVPLQVREVLGARSSVADLQVLLTYELQLIYDPEGQSSKVVQLSPTSTDGQLAIEVTCATDDCLTPGPVNDAVQTSLQLTVRGTSTTLKEGVHSTEFQVVLDDGAVLPFSVQQIASVRPTDEISDSVTASSGPPELVQTVSAEGGFPYTALSAFGSIWIGDTAGGHVIRVDASTGAVLATVDVDANAKRLTATDDAVYVTGNPTTRIDPSTNEASTIDGGAPALGITSDGTTVWTASFQGPIVRIDPDGTITNLDLPLSRWIDLAISNGMIWALSQPRDDSRLIAFDQTTGELRYDIEIPNEGDGFPVRLVADDNNVVVGADTSGGGGRTGKLVIVDPVTGTITDEVALNSRPEGIALTPNHIWTSGAVLDRNTLQILNEQTFGFTITRGPDGSIWGTLHGGTGTFTILRTAPGDLDN